jgi:hypothetical protein
MEINFELLKAIPLSNRLNRHDLYIIQTNDCIRPVSSIPDKGLLSISRSESLCFDESDWGAVKDFINNYLYEASKNATLKRFAHPIEFKGFLTALDILSFDNVLSNLTSDVFSPEVDFKEFVMFRNFVIAERFYSKIKPEKVSRKIVESVLKTTKQFNVYVDNFNLFCNYNMYFIPSCGYVFEALNEEGKPLMYMTIL